MTQKSSHERSPFINAALALDEELAQLDRVTKGFLSLDYMSDRSMKRSLTMLDQFNEVRDRIGACMKRLGATLEDTRSAIEYATEAVSERTSAIQERQELAHELIQRFQVLGEKVADVTSSYSEQSLYSERSEEPRIASNPELHARLLELVEDACALKEDAHSANMKMLEQNADMLRQKIQAASKRLLNLQPYH